MTSFSALPPAVQILIGVGFALQLILDVLALWRLFTTPPSRLTFGSRWPWLAIILVVSILGAILFLALGRAPAPVSEPDRRDESGGAPARRAVEALYGQDPSPGRYPGRGRPQDRP